MTDRVAEPPPRENLIRGMFPADLELRDTGEGTMPTLAGHFAVFDQWTEINSFFEGTFLERIAPGAFKKTFAENRDQMRVLFQHGKDPQVGDKPLGTIGDLREDDVGAAYEVPLFDTAYNRELIPGLKAGVYGASFRFKVMKDEFEHKPAESDHNPDGLPERTVLEAKVPEFGPVTFPAYAGATAGLRSLTDEFIAEHLLGCFSEEPQKLRAILDSASKLGEEPEPSAATTPEPEPEPSEATTPPTRQFQTEEEWSQWLQLTNWAT